MNDIIIGYFIILSGGLTSGYACFVFMKWISVRRWERVEAKFTNSGIKSCNVVYGPGVKLKEYVPDIRYEYSYNHAIYTGNSLTVRDRCIRNVDKERVENLVKEIPENPEINVNPVNPRQSCILSELMWGHINYILVLFVSGVLVSMAGFFVVYIS